MAVSSKIAVLAAAGVLAVGGAGIYAGALSVTGPGATTGSGSVNLTAACTEAVTLVPGESTYNSTDQISEYTHLTLSAGEDFRACVDQYITITVFANKAVTSTTEPGYSYTAGQQLGSITAQFGPGPSDTTLDSNMFSYDLTLEPSSFAIPDAGGPTTGSLSGVDDSLGADVSYSITIQSAAPPG